MHHAYAWAGRVRQVLRHQEQTVGKARLYSWAGGELHVVAHLLSEQDLFWVPGEGQSSWKQFNLTVMEAMQEAIQSDGDAMCSFDNHTFCVS